MKTQIHESAYLDLATAIITQAVRDLATNASH